MQCYTCCTTLSTPWILYHTYHIVHTSFYILHHNILDYTLLYCTYFTILHISYTLPATYCDSQNLLYRAYDTTLYTHYIHFTLHTILHILYALYFSLQYIRYNTCCSTNTRLYILGYAYCTLRTIHTVLFMLYCTSCTDCTLHTMRTILDIVYTHCTGYIIHVLCCIMFTILHIVYLTHTSLYYTYFSIHTLPYIVY